MLPRFCPSCSITHAHEASIAVSGNDPVILLAYLGYRCGKKSKTTSFKAKDNTGIQQ